MNEDWDYQPIAAEDGFDRYTFDGEIRPTEQVKETFSADEIENLVEQVRAEVWRQIGLSFGQVFQHRESKQRLLVIDNLTIRERMVREYVRGESHEILECENVVLVSFEREYIVELLKVQN